MRGRDFVQIALLRENRRPAFRALGYSPSRPFQTPHYDSAPMSEVIVRLLANATSRTNCSVSLGPLLALRGQPTNVP